jgi:uncharacterized protein YegP (UPF0339 family)
MHATAESAGSLLRLAGMPSGRAPDGRRLFRYRGLGADSGVLGSDGGRIASALSEPQALLAFRATLRSEGQRAGSAMATATKKVRATGQHEHRAHDAGVPESLEFLLAQDNSGAYRGRLIAGDRTTLAQSGRSASDEDAEQTARHVRDGAASARLDRGAGGVDLVGPATRRDGPSNDLDAERWVDEGGASPARR